MGTIVPTSVGRFEPSSRESELDMVFAAILLILVVYTFFSGAYVVPQQQVFIIERLGRFLRVDSAGLHFKIPYIDRVAGKQSLRVQQLDNKISTKTQDNVFVEAKISVQYQVNPQKVADAFYQLENPVAQINAYVEDAIRAALPLLTLDAAFERKDDVAVDVQNSIAEAMDRYGYVIVKTLITAIDPDKRIKDAMNSINEANRRREAAKAQAEADKIAVVTRAEAEAEEMRLRGEGVANQRKAIVEGLSESMRELAESGLDEAQIMSVLLTNQYIDTLNKFAESPHGSTIFLPASPEGIEDMRTQLISSMEAARGTMDSSKSASSHAHPSTRRPATIAKVEGVCPHCGAPLDAGAKFCTVCGTDVNQA